MQDPRGCLVSRRFAGLMFTCTSTVPDSTRICVGPTARSSRSIRSFRGSVRATNLVIPFRSACSRSCFISRVPMCRLGRHPQVDAVALGIGRQRGIGRPRQLTQRFFSVRFADADQLQRARDDCAAAADQLRQARHRLLFPHLEHFVRHAWHHRDPTAPDAGEDARRRSAVVGQQPRSARHQRLAAGEPHRFRWVEKVARAIGATNTHSARKCRSSDKSRLATYLEMQKRQSRGLAPALRRRPSPGPRRRPTPTEAR